MKVFFSNFLQNDSFFFAIFKQKISFWKYFVVKKNYFKKFFRIFRKVENSSVLRKDFFVPNYNTEWCTNLRIFIFAASLVPIVHVTKLEESLRILQNKIKLNEVHYVLERNRYFVTFFCLLHMQHRVLEKNLV